MKTIVEWGKPKAACKDRPCGATGSFVAHTQKQARLLAPQLFHTLTEGRESVPKGALDVSQMEPRKVLWSKDRDAWVCVTLMDDVHRGAYAALADKEAENPGYDRCPKCGNVAGDRHRMACPMGPGQVEASLEHATKRWYFQRSAFKANRFNIVEKAFYDENRRGNPDGYADPKLWAKLPKGFDVIEGQVRFDGDANKGRQALLDAGFIEHSLG